MTTVNIGPGSGGIATVLLQTYIQITPNVNNIIPSNYSLPVGWLPPTISAANSPAVVLPYSLSMGDNTIGVEGTAAMAILIPPSGNTHAILLKGASGDTGVSINETAPTFLTLNSSQTSFILNAAATISGFLIFWI